MEIKQQRKFPISAKELVGLLTDKSFYEARYDILGVEDYSFEEFGESADGYVVHILRTIAVDSSQVPAFARKFVGSHTNLSTKFVWQNEGEAPYSGRYNVTMPGAPATIEGTVVINATGDDTCEQDIDIDVTCNVPVVGKKLAKILGERVEQTLKKDYEATLTFLEQRS